MCLRKPGCDREMGEFAGKRRQRQSVRKAIAVLLRSWFQIGRIDISNRMGGERTHREARPGKIAAGEGNDGTKNGSPAKKQLRGGEEEILGKETQHGNATHLFEIEGGLAGVSIGHSKMDRWKVVGPPRCSSAVKDSKPADCGRKMRPWNSK